MSIDTERLKKNIEQAGISLEELAQKIGMNRSTMYRKLKCGGIKFTAEEILKMVEAIHISKEEAAAIFFAETVA